MRRLLPQAPGGETLGRGALPVNSARRRCVAFGLRALSSGGGKDHLEMILTTRAKSQIGTTITAPTIMMLKNCSTDSKPRFVSARNR